MPKKTLKKCKGLTQVDCDPFQGGYWKCANFQLNSPISKDTNQKNNKNIQSKKINSFSQKVPTNKETNKEKEKKNKKSRTHLLKSLNYQVYNN